MAEPISDRCPVCYGSLFIGKGGWITCSLIGCPNPATSRAIEMLREEEREAGYREGSAAALTVAAADIRLLASEGWTHAKAVDVLEMAARRIESIARGENLCSICRRYHGKEITHACE